MEIIYAAPSSQTSPPLIKSQCKLSAFVLLAAKQTIGKAWKKQFLQFTEIKQHIDLFLINEKLTSILSS